MNTDYICTAKPGALTGVYLTGRTDSSISVGWEAPPPTVPVTQYHLEQGLGAIGPFSEVLKQWMSVD